MHSKPLRRTLQASLPFNALRERAQRNIGFNKGSHPATLVLRDALAITILFFLAAIGSASGQQSFMFPSVVNVGSSSLPQTVTVTFQNTGTLGAVQVLTAGSPNLDFASSASTCIVGTNYSAGLSCTAVVTLMPRSPGIRIGAIVLVDSSGNPLGYKPLYGMGVGPLSVMTAGEITTVAGSGHLSTGSVTGTLAVDASIREPFGVAIDGAGEAFYTDNGNNLIDKVDLSGNLVAIAGTGVPGFSPNGTAGVNTQISAPGAILIDGAGNVFFTEEGNSTVREIVKATGLIQTVAGTGAQGYSGDGGAASLAVLNQPEGLALDAANNLYIADTGNNVIRKINASTGIITTIAGSITPGYAGDGQNASAGLFNEPWGLFAASDGSLYIADYMNNAVRRIDPSGKLTTIAGNGSPSYSGDTTLAVNATLNHPAGVALDAAGDIFISDSENNVVRKINAATKIITTFAGNSAASSAGDGVDADSGNASLNKPYGISLDGSGDLLIADRLGLKVRDVLGATGRIVFRDIKVTNTSPPTTQTIDNDGNAALHLSSITAISNAVVDRASTTCSTAVAMAPSAECRVGVDFKPAAVGSPVTGSVNVASDSPTSPAVIYLVGNSLSIEPTTTTLTSSVNPSSVGGAVTFTALVASNSSSLTGSVQFLDGTTLLGGTAQLLNTSSRTATLTTTNLALGSHSITAVYSGDNANQTSTSAALIQVVKQSTSLLLSADVNPSHVYDTVTFTVVANESPSGGSTPTGTIVFSADGSLLPSGSVTLNNNGSASYSTALLSAGSHTITATYAGDTNNLPGSSNTLTQVVNLAVTTTSLATSNASVPLTTPVTFTASVNGGSTSTPTGTVIFMDGSTAIATVTLNNAGAASFTISTLTTGSHQITASYQGDADFASCTSAAITETIQKIATSTFIVSGANPADAGSTINFAVTVTAANSTLPNVPVTGSVNLMEGAAVLGTGTLSASGAGPAMAIVSIPVSSFAPGSHAITAVYSGDGNYVNSTSSALLETVNAATTHVVLTTGASAVIATKPVTLTATVSGSGGTPTGSVSFMEGAATLGNGTLANGVASFTTMTLPVGTHSIIAVYQGDAKDSASTSNTITIVVNAATTSVSLSPSQNPTNFGQPFTLTATVTGNGSVPQGSVTFFDGTTALQSVQLNARGVASYATSTLTDGTHIFTAAYGGDANDTTSTSPTLSVVVLQTISLSLTSTSPNPSVARSNVHFIATVTALQGIQPTGSITFKDGSNVLGTGLINGSTATFDTAALSVGTHAIVASYGGDGSTQPFNSAVYTQIVNAAGASISLASSANPATFGTLLTFTASASSPAGALTGTVKFQDGGTSIGSGTLSSTGVATFATTALSAGVHSIVAAYQGDANDQPASSSALQQVVEHATTVTITSSQNPLLTLSPVTITATVGNGGAAVASGTLVFSEDSTTVATMPVDGTGAATLSLPSLSAGTHNFTATYSGDPLNLASVSAPYSEVVQLRATSDVLTTSASSLTGGQQITLISVLRWSGSATPTGTVSFLSGIATLATSPVDASGVATVTVLLSGTSATLSSAYSGDASYAASTSAPDLVTIGPAPDFTLNATPTSFTLVSKQHNSVTITVTSVKNFTDTLSFGCLGLPLAATCSFSKDQMVLDAGDQQTVLLTVDTGNPLLAGAQARNDAPVLASSYKLAFACLIPGGFLLSLLGLRAKKLRGFCGLLLLLCLAILSSTLSGCGTIKMNGTPPGTYSFNISAVGKTGVSESIPVTMIVTQ